MNTPTLSDALANVTYPQREIDDAAPRLRDTLRWMRAALRPPTAAQLPAAVQQACDAARPRLANLGDEDIAARLPLLRRRLQKARLRGAAAGEALALVAEMARRRLGITPYPAQILAAWLMLDGRLAEMATGEGKTLAAGIAAAVAALGGLPVHLLTANDYLVQRDRRTLAPLYRSLGLVSAVVLPKMGRELRAQAYASDIVYLTARELAFDYLRDHMLLRGERDPRLLAAGEIAAEGAAAAPPRPALPGLCLAIVDEADSILLDEATLPLILALPAAAADTRAHGRAMALSRQLQRGRDYLLQSAPRGALLTDAGRAAVGEAVRSGDGAALRPERRAHELVEAALMARFVMRRDRDYAVIGARVQLIDEVTGRIADGRHWTGALQAMVELKEGLAVSAPTRTGAQITYQRFFPRYLRLGGMSGTLLEARRELRVLYDGTVCRVPLSQPDRRRWLGERMFADTAARDAALVRRVQAMVTAGRPVLVGTDSVGASMRVSLWLHAAGVAHRLLNAVQDGDEAEQIALAGRAGTVTVATNIAGRGTDIRLDEAACAAGGLHVIAAMRNRSQRIDRQLIGRAGRHGDPGSAERLLALDDPLLAEHWPRWLRRATARCAAEGTRELPLALGAVLAAGAQWLADLHDRSLRRQLRLSERRADETYAFAGGTE